MESVSAAAMSASARPALYKPQIEWLLICCCHDKQLLLDARGVIQDSHFYAHEYDLLLFWRSLLHVVDTYGAPTKSTLQYTLLAWAQELQQENLPQSVTASLFGEHGLVEAATNDEAARNSAMPANIEMAREILRRFGVERGIVRPASAFFSHGIESVPENVDGFIRTLDNQWSRVASLQEIPRCDPAPEFGAEMPPVRTYQLTGVPWWDKAIGGQASGEVYLFIGVTGSGKSTFGLQLSQSLAKSCFARQVTTGEHSWVCYATYEESPSALWPKLWSAAFRIPRDKTIKFLGDGDWSVFSTQETLCDYERRLQRGSEVLSEQDRYVQGRPILQSCFEILDMSGSQEFAHAGRGGVPELVSYLARLIDRHHGGVPPVAVIIDYVGLVVGNQLQAENKDPQRYRTEALGEFPNWVRRDIAAAYDTTVWCLHQVSGAETKSSPTGLLHHSDAKGCKSMGDNAAVCACLGSSDKHTGCRRLNFSKTRSRSELATPPLTLLLDEEFAMLVDVTSKYQMVGGKFVSNEDAARIVGANTANAPTAQGPPRGLESPWTF